MPRSVGTIALLCLAGLLAGCAQPAADAPAPPTDSGSLSRWTFPLDVHTDLPEHIVQLEGLAENDGGPFLVRAISIARTGHSAPIQTLDAVVEVSRRMLEDGRALEVLDMNFDGYNDFRVIELPSAGPNRRACHWLYDTEKGVFVESPALDELTSTRFDPEATRVTSSTRESASRYLEDTYEYSDGRLVQTRREVREYSEPGRFRMTVSEPTEDDGELRVVEERVVEEPGS